MNSLIKYKFYWKENHKMRFFSEIRLAKEWFLIVELAKILVDCPIFKRVHLLGLVIWLSPNFALFCFLNFGEFTTPEIPLDWKWSSFFCTKVSNNSGNNSDAPLTFELGKYNPFLFWQKWDSLDCCLPRSSGTAVWWIRRGDQANGPSKFNIFI